MRIDAMTEISQIYQANGTKKKVNTTSAFSRDSVEISNFGKDLQVARAAIQSAPDVRKDKVQQIKAEIANGTYNVPMSAVADKLLNGFTL